MLASGERPERCSGSWARDEAELRSRWGKGSWVGGSTVKGKRGLSFDTPALANFSPFALFLI